MRARGAPPAASAVASASEGVAVAVVQAMHLSPVRVSIVARSSSLIAAQAIGRGVHQLSL